MNSRYRLRSINKIILLVTVIMIAAILTGCSAPQAVSTPITSPSVSALPSPSSQTPTPTPPPAAPSPAVSGPSPSLTPTPPPTPLPIYTPPATPYIPTGADVELFQYILGLINQDRQNAGLTPVVLNYNAAAQNHAIDMLKNNFLAHWGTDGLKPYMRYTLEGGLNYEGENSAYSTGSGAIDVKQEIQSLGSKMMYDDASSNWAHRDNILNKWHKKVNIGIAYDASSVALVEQFEGDYVEFFQPPTIAGNILSLSGSFTQTGMVLNNVAIAYDELPQPLTPDQLNNGPYHSYGLGNRLGFVLSPPPPGQQYANLPPDAIIATKWDVNQSGQFAIQVDISPILSTGKGVYTIVMVAIVGSDHLNLTNYSIFVK